MEIELKRCNNIEHGIIDISEKKLNIKYGINGTGKTTISRAIKNSIDDKINSNNSLLNLKSFKYRNDEDNNPEVLGVENINNVKIFNEEYVSQYVFIEDDLIKNSFEIFIRNDEYEKRMSGINELVEVVSNAFREDEDIENLIIALSELSKCFGTATKISKSSSFHKGLSNGNKIDNIPEGLEDYRKFIQHKENTKWFKWQINGTDFVDISNTCPYCTSEIEERKDKILKVKDEYDAKLIEHLNKVLNIVEKLSGYFNPETYNKIIDIAKSIKGYKKEHESFILEIREQITTLVMKLEAIKTIHFKAFKDVDKVIRLVEDYKIDLDFLHHLNSEQSKAKINLINKKLDVVIEKAGELQGEVNKQKKNIEDTIKKYESEIDNFLVTGGYNYNVNIKGKEDGTYKMILEHNDVSESDISSPKTHLSFGERNAFSLVLFMYEALKDNPDLIILDDPISSFDKNKKFAIMNMLFRGKNSFKNKTVLMLTHDFEPIVDTIYHFPHIFEPVPNAFFLENGDGNLKEIIVEKKDINTFPQISIYNIENHEETLFKLIYLRRLYELNNEKGLCFELLSNIFHKRGAPIIKGNNNKRKMTKEELEKAEKEIKLKIPEFNYNEIYKIVSDDKKLIKLFEHTTINYEKVQIYRILVGDKPRNKNNVIMKFLNETFHLENDYMYQLNPYKYQTIPQYIVKECKKDIKKYKDNISDDLVLMYNV